MAQPLLFAFVRGGAIALILALCGLGCSDSAGLNPVQGKVLHKNQPLAGALVTFHPKGSTDIKADRPTALTKEDGTFTVQTGPKEGAPAGEYVVTIICPQPVKKGGKGINTGSDETTDVLSGKYAEVNNSKLPVTIKSGPNQLEPFDLK